MHAVHAAVHNHCSLNPTGPTAHPYGRCVLFHSTLQLLPPSHNLTQSSHFQEHKYRPAQFSDLAAPTLPAVPISVSFLSSLPPSCTSSGAPLLPNFPRAGLTSSLSRVTQLPRSAPLFVLSEPEPSPLQLPDNYSVISLHFPPEGIAFFLAPRLLSPAAVSQLCQAHFKTHYTS